MNHKKIIKGLFLTLGIVTLQACESDFTEAGSNIVGDGKFDIVSYTVKDIKAYNQPYGAVDGSRLNETSFGYIKNGLFGESSNNLVVQVLDNGNTFAFVNDNPIVDSVYVYLPYFSQFDKVENDENKYKLKNTYGDGTFNLEVYQNGYYLNNEDITAGGSLKFYSNTLGLFDAQKVNAKPLNNSSDATQNKQFTFSKREKTIYKTDDKGDVIRDEASGKPLVKERLAPGMWLDLDKAYFQDFIEKNKAELGNSSSFNNLFRGLLFKANGNGSKGMAGLVDITKGKLVIILRDDKKETTTKEAVEKQRKEITLTFAPNGNTSTKFNVNLYNNSNDEEYKAKIASANSEKGDEFLYLRGGEGSIAIIDLLRSNDFEELKRLKEEKVLINEAYLTIFVDRNQMNGLPNPERLFLYDYDNAIPLSDFTSDNMTTAQSIKSGYNGIFVKEDQENNKEGNYYKFKITDHVRGVIRNETNASPKLALTVANNFANAGYSMQSLETPIDNTPKTTLTIPSLSLSCPIGTVLHGPKTTDSDKKMKLEIFYTKVKK